MSMFHELMMRKKEEIMYATIKGSLTESPYGVFSGFSTSNYLLTQDKIIPKKDLTISISLTTNNISSQCFFSSGVANHRYLACTIEGGRFLGYGYSVNGTGWEGGYKTTTYELESNTKYNIVFEITKNYVKVKIKKASETTFTEFTNTVSDYIHDVGSPLTLAKDFNSTKYFDGTIDLNQSYIKLNSTKYNLQAVVGYTIVGSPTITDGVVSGVNTTNGIFTASSIPSFQTFEFVAKVGSVWDSSGSYLPVCAFNDSSGGYKYISAVNSTKRLSFSLANNDTNKVGIENFPYATALTGSGVYIRLLAQKNTNDWTYTIAYSTDKQTWTQGQLISAVSIEGKPICFIKNSLGTTGGDTWIDMKETSIKINNKLWFNGQQA